MRTHVDVTWYGCPKCHMIWPDDRLCCELLDGDPPASELEWLTFEGATLTEWRDLPDDGAWHPNVTKFCCQMGETADLLEGLTVENHAIRRAAWLVDFDDDRVAPMHVCYECARVLFGVTAP